MFAFLNKPLVWILDQLLQPNIVLSIPETQLEVALSLNFNLPAGSFTIFNTTTSTSAFPYRIHSLFLSNTTNGAMRYALPLLHVPRYVFGSGAYYTTTLYNASSIQLIQLGTTLRYRRDSSVCMGEDQLLYGSTVLRLFALLLNATMWQRITLPSSNRHLRRRGACYYCFHSFLYVPVCGLL